MTAREFIEDRGNTLAGAWMASWLPQVPAAVIVAAGGPVYDAKTLDATVPAKVQALGWSGLTTANTAEWIGFDLDVGHGSKSFPSTAAALEGAHALRASLKGCAEIRHSKNGAGFHVRHWCAPANLSNANAVTFAKRLVARLGLPVDPTPLGRQAFWFWTAPPGPDSFRLVAEDDGLETYLQGGARHAA